MLFQCPMSSDFKQCYRNVNFVLSYLFNQPVEQDDLNYASIRFSHNQTDPVYYNIRQAGPRRQREEEEEEEEVDYTDINFKSAGATPR